MSIKFIKKELDYRLTGHYRSIKDIHPHYVEASGDLLTHEAKGGLGRGVLGVT